MFMNFRPGLQQLRLQRKENNYGAAIPLCTGYDLNYEIRVVVWMKPINRWKMPLPGN